MAFNLKELLLVSRILASHRFPASEGWYSAIKHFVANDQEHERTAADSVVSERALREIYLYP